MSIQEARDQERGLRRVDLVTEGQEIEDIEIGSQVRLLKVIESIQKEGLKRVQEGAIETVDPRKEIGAGIEKKKGTDQEIGRTISTETDQERREEDTPREVQVDLAPITRKGLILLGPKQKDKEQPRNTEPTQ
jgi:hypothetical protein